MGIIEKIEGASFGLCESALVMKKLLDPMEIARRARMRLERQGQWETEEEAQREVLIRSRQLAREAERTKGARALA